MSEHKEASRFKQTFRIFALVALAFSWSQASFAGNDPDVTGDGRVNILDVSTVSSCLGRDLASVTRCECADTNGDRVIDKFDYGFVASKVGSSGYPIEPNACQVIKPNTPPTANAGLDQTVTLGQSVSLNASGSSDADGNALSFKWSFITTPAGSSATISNSSTVAPGFIADRPGNYNLQVTVSDGKANSTDTVTISTINSPPVANAGSNQTIFVGGTITLNGSASSDADGHSLGFVWSFASVPLGSSATLSDAASTTPNFVADKSGSYEVQLIVNDGTIDSAPSRVTVSTRNTAPVANAGADQSMILGSATHLNGAASSDVDGNLLSFAWSLVTRPKGSAATLSTATAVNPTFIADLPGTYVAQLIVNDGAVESVPDTVTITTNNVAPVANAGADQNAALGSMVQLDGSASSDPEGLPLSYSWSVVTHPVGSSVLLSATNIANPVFVIDRVGTYIAQLIVNDGVLNSAADTVIVTTSNTVPVANAGSDQSVVVGATVTLDGRASADADGNALSFSWSFTSVPPGSAVPNLTNPISSQPSFSATHTGKYVAQLIVGDGVADSAPDTATVEAMPAVNNPPVARPDSYSMNEDSVLFGTSVLANDFDADNDSLSARTVADISSGALTFNVDGTFTYTPFANFNGNATFSYRADDGADDSGVAVVTIRVAPTNDIPIADAGADLTGNVGAVVVLDGSASSDPDGDTLTYQWSFIERPAGSAAALVNPTAINSSFTPDVAGAYNVRLVVNDGKINSAQVGITIAVAAQVTTGDLPLDLSLAVNPSVANSGDQVTISLLRNGGIGTVTTRLSIDGQNVPLVNGTAQFAAGASGAHRIIATATDTQGTLTREAVYSVRDAADTTAPIAQIVSPVADAEITAPLTITGTASDARLAFYQLLLRPVGTLETAWQEIGLGFASVTNGTLGKLDPTQISNGLYQLALNVVDANGQATSTTIPIEIYRDLKIGQFSVTFEDLNVEAVGIPIRVTRTYDTRRKAENLDFGYGWSVDYQSVQLRKNVTFGLGWEVVSRPRTFELCLFPSGKRKINVTLPTGQVERFDANLVNNCGFFQLPPLDFKLTPLAGTTSTLEIINIPLLRQQGGVIFDFDNLEPWNPQDFKLTTQEGFVYFLKEGVGIVQIRDPYGNTLTYGKNGITHSNGQAVPFTRDAQGRITSISDSLGKTIRYAYDARGDLISVTDRLNQVSQYSYNRSHGLTDFTDPRGIKVARQIYDDEGRLIATIDADGKRIEMTHDIANNKEIVKDRRGNITTYTYDTSGNVTEILNALGEKTTYTYDGLGNEKTVTNALNQTTTRSFDAQRGYLLSEADPLGQSTTYTYDLSGQPTSVKDPLGNATTYTNTGAQLDQIIEPLGRASSFGYDNKGNLRSINVAGDNTQYSYDARGNRTTETDAGSNVSTYIFDANNREAGKSYQRTTANGSKVVVSTTRVLDAEGRVTAETDALGFTSRTSYNAAGKVTSQTDPMDRVTSYDYDAQARLVKTSYPDGTSEATTFDAEGNEITQTDRAGRVTRMEYDALNRLVKTVYPDGTANQTVYDAAGRVDKTHDAQGNPITNVYDAASRLTQTTDALGFITQFAYNANGIRTRMTDSRGNVTLYVYDALNRLIKTTYPDLTFSTIVWRIDGRKDIETDAAGNSVQYGYDTLGRLASVTQTVGGVSYVTAYGYDELGNKVRQTDAENRATQWAFDNNNRVTQRTLPLNQTETYAYDATGNRTGQTDFLGKTSQVFYDNDNRPVLKKLPDGTQVSYAYTNAGQIASITDSRGTTTYSYDTQDRLTRVDHPDGTYLAYAYDANGNRTELSTPSGTVRYAYDKLNRLISVTDLQNKVTAYQYDANGNRTKEVLPNGTETQFTFNANNRLTEVVHKKTADASVLRGFSYTLAANGQRTGMTEYDAAGTSRTIVYAYDAMGRLTQEAVTDVRTPAASRTTDYSYDKVGNRKTKTETVGATLTSTTYQYDANDRLTTEAKTSGGIATTTTYTYDANGNTRAKTVNGVGTFYTYDSENKLIAVKQGATEATAQTTVTFQYDGRGNRISKTGYVNGVKDKTTSFLVDTNLPYAQVVEEREAQGNSPAALSAVYVYGNSLIQQTRGGQGTFYHADGLGSTRMLSDATGAVTDAYDYEAFGNVTNQVGATQNDYRFAGERFDQETGFYYNRARYLNLEIGRFVTMDSFAGKPAEPLSLNKYIYANVDPVNNIDPSGEISLGEFGAASSVQGALRGVAVPNVGRQFFGRAAVQAGRAFERQVERVLLQCLKPSAKIKQVKLKTKDGRFAIPDFMIQMGDKIKVIEAKTNLPTSRLPDAMKRLAKQIQSGLDNKYDLLVVSKTPHRPDTYTHRMQEILKLVDRTGTAGSVTYVNSLTHLLYFLGDFVNDECLGGGVLF